MSVVYVVQDQRRRDKKTGELVSKFDLKDAERFGQLEFLLGPSARPFAPAHVIAQLERKLVNFGKTDYLLLIGNPCLIGFAVAVASAKTLGLVSMLQWDGMSGEYRQIDAVLPTQEDMRRVALRGAV